MESVLLVVFGLFEVVSSLERGEDLQSYKNP